MAVAVTARYFIGADVAVTIVAVLVTIALRAGAVTARRRIRRRYRRSARRNREPRQRS